ncbi:hypothetical protein QBC33DRAFT_524848 [Phialemonium atrogriseum]|uniref:Uncharacterized protein n=1 Tax=Phialemonium atrogriseum TaxID=1093897 RepID=A0AAJ0FR01_9PEZI|nr:uncharacterized protein QBC33DRAFT_524848 [Phialemonium atrogriseum]KAK1771793.1 hypothetical protein QBC33DRAFT_524848 [Phialemonium atrogriseum]
MGKRVNETNIQRYLKRKPHLLTRYHRGHRPNPEEFVRVTCVTPPPPPESVWRVPGTLTETELVLADCRDYLRSSRDSGSWSIDDEGVVVGANAGRRASEAIDDILAKFFAAADLLSRSDFSGAFRLLDLAFRSTATAVSLNVPRVLSLLMAVFSRLDRRGQRDTLNIFRKYIQSQADSISQSNTKLPVVLRRLGGLEVEKYDEVLPRIYDLMIEQSDELFGPGSNLSLEVYWDRYGASVVKEDTPDQVRSIKKELDKIPHDAKLYPWVLRHQRLYAWKISQMKRDQGKFNEAQEALRAVEHTYTDSSHADASRHWCFAAIIEEKRGDMVAAEAYHRLSLRMSTYSGDEDAIQFAMFKLTELLDKVGRNAEAEKIREYGRGRISELAAEVQWDWEEFRQRTAAQPVTVPAPESSAGG